MKALSTPTSGKGSALRNFQQETLTRANIRGGGCMGREFMCGHQVPAMRAVLSRAASMGRASGSPSLDKST